MVSAVNCSILKEERDYQKQRQKLDDFAAVLAGTSVYRRITRLFKYNFGHLDISLLGFERLPEPETRSSVTILYFDLVIENALTCVEYVFKSV